MLLFTFLDLSGAAKSVLYEAALFNLVVFSFFRAVMLALMALAYWDQEMINKYMLSLRQRRSEGARRAFKPPPHVQRQVWKILFCPDQ